MLLEQPRQLVELARAHPAPCRVRPGCGIRAAGVAPDEIPWPDSGCRYLLWCLQQGQLITLCSGMHTGPRCGSRLARAPARPAAGCAGEWRRCGATWERGGVPAPRGSR